MSAPTQLDPTLTATAERLRGAEPHTDGWDRPPLALIERGARRRRRRTATRSTLAAAALVAAGLVVGPLALPGDQQEVATFGRADPADPADPVRQAIDQVSPLLPSLAPDQRLSYAFLQREDAGLDERLQTFAAVNEPGLADRALLVTSAPSGPVGLDGAPGERRTVGDRDVVVLSERAGPILYWIEDGTYVWMQGRQMTEAELEELLDAVTVTAGGVELGANSLGLRPIEVRRRSATTSLTVQWTPHWTLESTAGSSLLWQLYFEAAGEPVVVRGRAATLFASGDGTAVAWEEPAGTVRVLSATSVDRAAVLATAEALQPLDAADFAAQLDAQGVLLDTTVGGSVPDGMAAPDGVAAPTTTATSAAVDADGSPGQVRYGDTADVPPGTAMALVDGSRLVPLDEPIGQSVHTVVVRTVLGEPWMLMTTAVNVAGTCRVLPIGPLPIVADDGGPAGPDAAAFRDECDGSTYTLDGRCLDGCLVGLYAAALEDRDGAIWGTGTSYDTRRPRVG